MIPADPVEIPDYGDPRGWGGNGARRYLRQAPSLAIVRSGRRRPAHEAQSAPVRLRPPTRRLIRRMGPAPDPVVVFFSAAYAAASCGPRPAYAAARWCGPHRLCGGFSCDRRADGRGRGRSHVVLSRLRGGSSCTRPRCRRPLEKCEHLPFIFSAAYAAASCGPRPAYAAARWRDPTAYAAARSGTAPRLCGGLVAQFPPPMRRLRQAFDEASFPCLNSTSLRPSNCRSETALSRKTFLQDTDYSVIFFTENSLRRPSPALLARLRVAT